MLEYECLSTGLIEDVVVFFFVQAEDGIRDLVRSRGLGDVYKRQQQRLGAAQMNMLVVEGL